MRDEPIARRVRQLKRPPGDEMYTDEQLEDEEEAANMIDTELPLMLWQRLDSQGLVGDGRRRRILLRGGAVVAGGALENPQRFGGSDVMTRISYEKDFPGAMRLALRRALNHELRDIYRAARDHDTFVNLDMEEYRDLELSVEAFISVLSRDEFRDLPAGIGQGAFCNGPVLLVQLGDAELAQIAADARLRRLDSALSEQVHQFVAVSFLLHGAVYPRAHRLRAPASHLLLRNPQPGGARLAFGRRVAAAAEPGQFDRVAGAHHRFAEIAALRAAQRDIAVVTFADRRAVHLASSYQIGERAARGLAAPAQHDYRLQGGRSPAQ